MSVVEDSLAEIIVGHWGFHDTSFLIIIDNAEADLYDVYVRYYVDADRAGFACYVSKPILKGVPQVTATAVEKKLNEVVAAKKAEHEARFA